MELQSLYIFCSPSGTAFGLPPSYQLKTLQISPIKFFVIICSWLSVFSGVVCAALKYPL